jgi:DNA-binding NtrC family response regulator
MARILLVDDEDLVRQLFEAVLELEAHEVTTASDGNGALAALATGTFDVVVTDIVMPDKEGIEVIMEMRKMRPELPIIAMSGGGRGSSADYLEMAALLGAKRTLAKPFSAQDLLDAVSAVLNP